MRKMPRKNYEILESEKELLDMIRNEKKGRFRDRLRFLWLLKSGNAETMTRAAELCGISLPTAAEWLRRYENGGISELLCLKTVPGRQRAISGEIPEDPEKRLSEPEGFRSYKEIRTWLMDEYDIDIPYKTVHKTVLCYLGSEPESPRPSHVGKNEEEVRGSEESFPTKASEIKNNTDDPIRIFSATKPDSGLSLRSEKESLCLESDLSDKYSEYMKIITYTEQRKHHAEKVSSSDFRIRIRIVSNVFSTNFPDFFGQHGYYAD